MTSPVRRASAFAVVGSLVVPVVALGAILPQAALPFASAAPFLVISGIALFSVDDGLLFELFARPGDRRDRRLYGLAGFSLAIGGLTLLVTHLGMPVVAFLVAVLVVSIGPVGAQATHGSGDSELTTAAFVVGGASGAVLGSAIALSVAQRLAGGGQATPLAQIAFLGVVGALIAALLRVTLVDRDDPLVLVSVALALWVLAVLPVGGDPRIVAVGIAVSGALGYVARRLQTASVHGMVTGVLLSLLAIVLGGGDPGWVLLLVTFFGVGGLSTKFKYDRKVDRDIAEADEGARGSANVLANATVATFALIGAAASPDLTGLDATPFLLAFAGSLAAALADTLSSEIGGTFDRPRLITTFEVVDPGTDGAITWQGEVAGLGGASLIGVLAVLTFPSVGALGALVIVGAGVVGMTVDSLLGATIEGRVVGNQGVNFLATAAAGLTAAVIALL
ncbi:DUF92 domain-containing protein [Halococcoides cellulosivorans]|uniref:DUF92 domain-containing protein n=1 Tax=Halococcoides cellulosivorans TaxID=1679096 RepID=A0A2R4X0H7_9EURY|nr:DUF92 domain-containing protein [Halococcoides cellulosivorans]AWB27287.1 DUF92 domain-containing protein [Halococcoides cellulosivorans]